MKFLRKIDRCVAIAVVSDVSIGYFYKSLAFLMFALILIVLF